MSRTFFRAGLAGILLAVSACSGGSPPGGEPSHPDATGETSAARGELTSPAAAQPASGAETAPSAPHPDPTNDPAMSSSSRETATFGAGCFWCVEAVLEQLPGVLDVTSGYMGGTVPQPTYEQVCTGRTGHAEVVQVTFDPSTITYDTLLDWFFKLHDPTTLNRQGGDVGTQYRSAIFWHSDAQRAAAEAKKKSLDASGTFADPIVTEITQAGPYYEAEVSHQDYYRINKSKNPYCRAVITPKLDKLGLEK